MGVIHREGVSASPSPGSLLTADCVKSLQDCNNHSWAHHTQDVIMIAVCSFFVCMRDLLIRRVQLHEAHERLVVAFLSGGCTVLYCFWVTCQKNTVGTYMPYPTPRSPKPQLLLVHEYMETGAKLPLLVVAYSTKRWALPDLFIHASVHPVVAFLAVENIIQLRFNTAGGYCLMHAPMSQQVS